MRNIKNCTTAMFCCGLVSMCGLGRYMKQTPMARAGQFYLVLTGSVRL